MLWLPALVPIIGAAAIFAWPSERRMGLGAAGVLVLTATLALAVLAATQGWSEALEWGGPLRLIAVLTPLSSIVAILVPGVALAVVLYAAAHEAERGLWRLLALMVAFAGAMELLVIAGDFVTLLLGWELVGACSWALIGHRWRDADVPASANYAFVVTRFGDLGLFLAGMACFAATGRFAFSSLAVMHGPALGVVAAGLLLSAAAKSGQVPFAPWLFRAMAGPTSVSALLHAATMVAAGAFLLARLWEPLHAVDWFGPATIAIGLATALAGGIVGFAQFHAKKLLAASTSAHFGLMFVAVGAGFPGVAVLHLVAHAAFKAPLFLSAGVAEHAVGSYDLRRMRLGRVVPWTAAVALVAGLALAGLPPLGGGWTKDAIVSAAEARQGLPLALAVILAGGLSAAYAARFVTLGFGLGEKHQLTSPRAAERVGLGLFAVATLALSLLWLPGVEAATARLLAADFPERSGTGLLLSLAFVVTGLVVGVRGVRIEFPGWIAEWFGLPLLIDRLVVRPAVRFAESLAGVDDRLIDWGVAWTSRLAGVIARLGDNVGERLADLLPHGSARAVSMTGLKSMKLQTGLSHHYYLLIAGGGAGMLLLLFLWR